MKEKLARDLIHKRVNCKQHVNRKASFSLHTGWIVFIILSLSGIYLPETEFLLYAMLSLGVSMAFFLFFCWKYQGDYVVNCPECEHRFEVQDLKIVHVSDKCPYCAEDIVG